MKRRGKSRSEKHAKITREGNGTFLYVTGMEKFDEGIFREIPEKGLPVKVEIIKEKLDRDLQRVYLKRLGRIYRKACFLEKGEELWSVAICLKVSAGNKEAERIIAGDVMRMLAEKGVSTVAADGYDDVSEMAKRWSFVVRVLGGQHEEKC